MLMLKNLNRQIHIWFFIQIFFFNASVCCALVKCETVYFFGPSSVCSLFVFAYFFEIRLIVKPRMLKRWCGLKTAELQWIVGMWQCFSQHCKLSACFSQLAINSPFIYPSFLLSSASHKSSSPESLYNVDMIMYLGRNSVHTSLCLCACVHHSVS